MHKYYFVGVNEIGLREMGQSASELVRRAEAGEWVTITVAGRPAAVLGPVGSRTWRQWGEVAAVFTGAADADWAHDRELLDDSITDPWAGR